MTGKPKLNILVLSSWFPSKLSPFSGDFVQRHAMSIATLHNITVVYVVGSFEEKKITKEVFEDGNYKEIIVVFPKTKLRMKTAFTKWKLYLETIADVSKFDIIHVNVGFPVGILALYFNKIEKIPYVLTEHWTGYLPQDPVKIGFFRKFITKMVIENASYLLPVSENLGKAMLNFGKNNRLKVVRNVVDTEVFKCFSEMKNEKFTFLHISNLTYQKNITGMLNTAKRLWDEGLEFKFKIGGNGDLNPIIKFQKTHKLEDKLELFGSLSSNEVAKKMQESDCFVLFSRFENQPCVQNEAFATGLPLIASDVGGISELLPEGLGTLVASENESQLYDAMKSMVLNRDFLSKNEISNFAKEHFAVSQIAKKFDEVYQEILNEK